MQNKDQNQTAPIVALVVSGGTGTVDTPQTAIELRDALVAEAALLETVASDQANQIAADIVAKINGTIKVVEELRVTVGAPARNLVTAINEKSAEYLRPLLAQKERLAGRTGLMTKYAADKINRERQAEAERRKQLEDAAKKEAELANRAANASTPQEARAIEVERQQLQRTPIAVAPVATRAAGQSVGTGWDIEVLDAAEFYKAFPHLHKAPEVAKSAVATALKNPITRKQLEGCTAVRVFETVSTNVRSK